MVLVAGEYRRRGLATPADAPLHRRPRASGLVPVLDATPDGRAVYRALGFEDSWGFHRLMRRERHSAARRRRLLRQASAFVRSPTRDWPALCAYDAAAFGAERSGVLRGLRGRLPRPNSLPNATAGSPVSCSVATAGWRRNSGP